MLLAHMRALVALRIWLALLTKGGFTWIYVEDHFRFSHFRTKGATFVA